MENIMWFLLDLFLVLMGVVGVMFALVLIGAIIAGVIKAIKGLKS
jgi:hypothetical protein